MSNPDRYAVFGNPIAHSKSPEIHAEFARQCRHEIQYDKICVELGEFSHAADAFFDEGGKGLNVTVPFKHDACEYADRLTERARLAGAANCLIQQGDAIVADNTDGYGLVLDITTQLKWSLKGKRLLIVGAGGAVRGVLLPLLQEQPAEVVICNRTPEKAAMLASSFQEYGKVRAVGFGEEGEHPFDVIINGTSASLSGDVPAIDPRVFSVHSHVYDMVYGAEPTAFMTWAKSCGVTQVSDGWGMLVGQAAESYRLWRDTEVDFAQIKNKLSPVK